jgi:cytochrome b involved in lipid metabolism
MRKLTYTAFVAFWACVMTLLLTDRLVSASPEPDEPLTSYTLAQVAKHASETDCWMAIEGKVYDLSEYIPKHPTPPFVITSWCGKEATEGMRTKGYGRDHSPAGWAALDEYLIGELVEE